MIDARGLVCPMPVVMARNAIRDEKPAALEIMVDNRAAVENLTRFGTHSGYQVASEAQGEDYLVRMTK
ncbi:MAG: recombinase [Ruminococcaceae bacterium]|nr:recombinase [Oscillospiraceae bacterium]